MFHVFADLTLREVVTSDLPQLSTLRFGAQASEGSGFRVEGRGFRVWGLGFSGLGFNPKP